MAVIETWLTQDLQEPVQVQHLCGSFFSHNGNANRIGVKVFNNGSAASLSGTVSGYAVIEDGTTVPCTGSLSGNQASVLLPAAAYVPGNVCVTIMLTSGTTVTTLAALVATVVEARTDTQVDPGSVVTDWTNTINAALQTVEKYTGNIIATPYASLTYPVPLGKYCIYNNLLYRCATPISSSESWTSSHWTQTKLADDVSDLKSALNEFEDSFIYESIPYSKQSGQYVAAVGNTIAHSTWVNGYCIGFPVNEDETYLVKYGTMSYSSLLPYVFLCDSDGKVLYNVKNYNVNISEIEERYVKVPSGVTKIYIRSYETGGTANALSVLKKSTKYEQECIEKTALNVKVSAGTVTSGHSAVGETIAFNTDANWRHTGIDVSEGETYNITFKTFSYGSLISYVYLCDATDKIISIIRNTMVDNSYVENCNITIPSGISKVYIRSYETNSTNISKVYIVRNPMDLIGEYPVTRKLNLNIADGVSFSSASVGSKFAYSADPGWKIAMFKPKTGEKYKIRFSTLSYSSTIPYILICDDDDTVLERINNKSTNLSTIEEYTFIAEATDKKVYVRANKNNIVNELEVYTDNIDIADAVNLALKSKPFVYVACYDALDTQKSYADIVLDGATDEIVLQDVINQVCMHGGGTIKLSSGTVLINSFPNKENDLDDYVALMIPQTVLTQLFIEGDTLTGRTNIHVSPDCYEGLDGNTQYTILRGAKTSGEYTSSSNIHFRLQDVFIRLPWNQKKIRCLDMLYCNKVLIERVSIRAWINGYDGHYVSVQVPPAVAVEGCEGIRTTGGSNYGELNDYRNISVAGFYKGFRASGEHLIMINCGSIFCVYGWAFGDYSWTGGSTHPMVLIHCYDERDINLPLFDSNGESGNPNHTGNQNLHFIAFSVERIAAYTPGGVLGDYSKELYPGAFKGQIDYTIQTSYGGGGNDVTVPFWEDGSGYGIVSRNAAQLQACTTSVRLTYAPNYMQRLWDTDLNKEVICIDPANKTWVDVNGNNVDA